MLLKSKRNSTIVVMLAIALLSITICGCVILQGMLVVKKEVVRGERDYTIINRYINYYNVTPEFYFPVPSAERFVTFGFKELYHPLVSFYNSEVRELYDFKESIAEYASSKYISIKTTFESRRPRKDSYWFIYTSITIDLEQRKELLLSDLIDINDEFVLLLKNGKLARTDRSEGLNEEFGDPADLSRYSVEEIKRALHLCSVRTDEDNYIDKPFYFLTTNRLYLSKFPDGYGTFSLSTFYISLDDLDKFLKVEKW